jgi:cytochrome P450 family 2 subfamily U polypeptide 1
MFAEWSKELGPVFALRMMSKEFVVLNSYDAINEALVLKGNQLHHRNTKEGHFRMQTITEDFSNILSRNPDQQWKKMRKVCHQKIRMYDTGLIRIEEISNEMIKQLLEDFRNQQGKSFDPKDIVYHTVMCTIVALLLGKKTLAKDDDIFKKIFQLEQTMLEVLVPTGKNVQLDLFPWLRHFGHSTYEKVLSISRLRDEVWQ